MVRIRNILLPVLIIALVPIAIYLPKYTHKIYQYKVVNLAKAGPSLEDFNFTEYSDNGANKRFTIRAKKISAEGKRLGIFNIGIAKVMRIRDIEVTFFELNKPVSYIRAESAVLAAPVKWDNLTSAITEKIYFSRNISVMTVDRRTLTCDKLKWDKTGGRIYAGGNCVLRYKGKSVKADSLDADIKLKEFVFSNDSKKRFKALTKMFI